jgi:hypothetical protein
LSVREWALVAPTIALAILMGILPGIFLRPMEPSVARVIERVTGAQPARVRIDSQPSLHGMPATAANTAELTNGSVPDGRAVSPERSSRLRSTSFVEVSPERFARRRTSND